MRGDETQLFGALRLRAELSSVERTFVHPGTHSKWVRTRDGHVQRFRTYLTGELFGLLRCSSLLSGAEETQWDDEGFAAGIERGRV